VTIATAPQRLPLMGNLLPLIFQRDSYFAKLRTFGDIVELRFGTKPYYLVNEPSAVHQLLIGDVRMIDKGHFFDIMRPFFGNGILTCPHAVHLDQRRMLQPAFNRAALASYLNRAVPGVVQRLINEGRGRTVDMLDEMSRMSITLMTNFCVSADSEAIEREIQLNLPIFVEGMISRAVLPSWIDKIPTPENRRWNRAASDLRGAIYRSISAYRNAGVDHGDLLSMLLRSESENGTALPDQDICDQVLNILAAGSETTATSMAWFFYALGMHPEIEAGLLEELDTTLGGQPPVVEDLPRLPRMNHALLETLRLYHPIWFLGRRATVPIKIGGDSFPANTEFIYSIATLHRDPTIYPAPLEFRPQRWQDSPGLRHSFIPFGSGVRRCMGDNFALMEIGLIAATLLQHWRLIPVAGQKLKRIARASIQPHAFKLRLEARAAAGSAHKHSYFSQSASKSESQPMQHYG
jgi:cytochrome P450